MHQPNLLVERAWKYRLDRRHNVVSDMDAEEAREIMETAYANRDRLADFEVTRRVHCDDSYSSDWAAGMPKKPPPPTMAEVEEKNAELERKIREMLTELTSCSPVERACCHRHRRDTSRRLGASIAVPGPHDLMSSRFFGLLKTSEAPEKYKLSRFLLDPRKARRNPPGPDRP